MMQKETSSQNEQPLIKCFQTGLASKTCWKSKFNPLSQKSFTSHSALQYAKLVPTVSIVQCQTNSCLEKFHYFICVHG